MTTQEAKVNKCRVCLENNGELDWNDLLYAYSHIKYKDCYYKYTHLEYIDEDIFPTMLCRNCSGALEYIDAFISKAIETHLILQESAKFCIIDDKTNIKHNIKQESSNFETILVEEIDIKPEIKNLHMNEESDEEFLNISADETSSIPERCLTSIKNILKANPTKTSHKKRSEHSSDELTNDSSLSDKSKKPIKVAQPVCCSICSKVLASKYKAIQHEKIHIVNRERNETCVKCGLKFYCKLSLKSHMLTHIENREKSHKCEFCDKAFFNKGGLNIHRRIHLGQMISCTLCTKQFYRQIDLDKHMNSHSAVRITADIQMRKKSYVRCKDCGENVRTTNFKSHMAKHMNDPLFKCSICNKEFFFRKSCLEHVKKVHKKKDCEEIKNIIIVHKTNRISHLFLEQYSSDLLNN